MHVLKVYVDAGVWAESVDTEVRRVKGLEETELVIVLPGECRDLEIVQDQGRARRREAIAGGDQGFFRTLQLLLVLLILRALVLVVQVDREIARPAQREPGRDGRPAGVAGLWTAAGWSGPAGVLSLRARTDSGAEEKLQGFARRDLDRVVEERS